MTRYSLFIFLTSFSITLIAQSPIGAWENVEITDSGDSIRSIVIFSEGFQALTVFNASDGRFIHSNGGTWNLEGNMMTEKVEFHTDSSELVGEEFTFEVAVSDQFIELVDQGTKFYRIDDGKPGHLQGAWLMSGRVKDGKTQQRDTSLPRKTMKILSGTRFQWIAYNSQTKEFAGTGGGTYTTKEGKYVENIEFFSRDISRVGASLTFNFELVKDQWHHSGFSSKGDPLYEIWSIRQK